MADPLSVTASAAGLVSLGLTICSGLCTYYSSWKDTPKDITALRTSLQTLTKSFTLLYDRIQSPLFNHDVVDQVTESIIQCATGVGRLESKLHKVQSIKPGIETHLRRAQYPFCAKTIAKLQGELDRIKGNLDLAMDVLQIDASAAVLAKMSIIDEKIMDLTRASEAADQNLLTHMLEVRGFQERHAAKMISQEDLEIIRWLSPLDSKTKQLDALIRRSDGTCTWLLESAEFQTWLSTTGSVLWCPGIRLSPVTLDYDYSLTAIQRVPGRPFYRKHLFKSSLLHVTVISELTPTRSVIVEYLENWIVPGQSAIACIFCKFNEEGQTPANLLGNVLQQLLRHHKEISQDIRAKYTHHRQHGTRPSMPEISTLLQLLVPRLGRVFIIVDALDECPDKDKTRGYFLAELRACLPNIHLLVTSRDVKSIQNMFEKDIRIDIKADPKDIKVFISDQLEKEETLTKLLKDHDKDRKKIIETIVERSQGMFLLAALHMDAIAKEDNRRSLRESLQLLPDTIEQTYEEALNRIRSQDQRRITRAEQVLTWISCAKRPLSIGEVRCALSIRQGDTEIDHDSFPEADFLLTACCGLVIVDQESQVFRLVHYTAEEYFKRQRKFSDPAAHADLAKILVTYLGFSSFANLATETKSLHALHLGYSSRHFLLEKTDLLRYAVEYWGYHAGEALEDYASNNTQSGRIAGVKDSGKNPDVVPMIVTFLDKPESMSFLHAMTHHIGMFHYFQSNTPTNISRLQDVAGSGIYQMVNLFLDQGDYVDDRDSGGRTSLHKAAGNGHVEVCRALVQSGADINRKDRASRSPLHWAVVAGRLKMVQFLLNEGACSTREIVGTAAQKGHVEVLEMLVLQIRDHVERNETLNHALSEAAFTGQEAVVCLLLQKGRSWNISRRCIILALERAAKKNHVAIMEILLRTSPSINTHIPLTVLHKAVSCGHVKSTKLLLGAGTHPDLSDQYGDKPLHKATWNGYEGVIRILLEAGANPNSIGRYGETPMIIISKRVYRNSASIVTLLLEYGADVAATDQKFGRTSLEWCVLQGNEKVFEVLLPYCNIDPDRQAVLLLLTRLYRAVILNEDVFIERLLQDGNLAQLVAVPDLLLPYIPAKQGYKTVVQVFLTYGANIEACESNGLGALYLATAEGHYELVQWLLDRGADIERKCYVGFTALHVAARRGDNALVRLLLDRGANINAKWDGNTALSDALDSGENETAQLLLQRGADINSKPRILNGGTLLHGAAFRWGHDVVQLELLISNGADMTATNDCGETPLVVAVRGAKIARIRYFLEAGVDPNSVPSCVTPAADVYADDFDAALKVVQENKEILSRISAESE